MDIVRRNERGNDMGHSTNLYDPNHHDNGRFLGRFYDANLDTTYSSQLMGI